MNEQEKKTWQQPELEKLAIHLTSAGPGIALVDAFQNDPDEDVHYS